MVVVNMNNPNALIAMAQVSQNANNPYLVFCEYIKYCLFVNTSSKMFIKDLIIAIGKEFGIQIPYNIVINCLKRLEKSGNILIKKHQIKRIGFFDANKFDKERQYYQDIEDSIIESLIKYVSEYNKTWDKKYAKTQLINVLDRNGLAYDIFMQGDSYTSDNSNLFSNDDIEELLTYDEEELQELKSDEKTLFPDSYYVSSFINKIIKDDERLFCYLQQVCKGLMLCVGTYQLADNNVPPIKGTTFFFDTKLLLRLLGCAGEAAIDATNELVKLIKDNGGIICYYPQTWYEIDKAFEKAINCLQHHCHVYDTEMNMFVSKTKFALQVLEAKRGTFEKELEELNVFKREHTNFSDVDNISFGFDYNDFQQYLKKNLNWDDCVIENDALSIWETHMLREGKYNEYCGTKDKLCVFVTTNAKLIGMSLKYSKNRPNTKGVKEWKGNRLPVITDMRLTCRLWNPTLQADKMSLLYLTANTVAAQRPTQQFYDKVRELALQFKNNNIKYKDAYLPSFFDDKITDALFKNTRGDKETLNIENFTNTIEELYSVQIKEQKEINYKIVEEKDSIQSEYNLQTKEIISSAVQKYKNRLGILRLDLYVILKWRTILNVVFVAIGAIFSYLSGNLSLLFIAILPVLLTLIEKFCTSNFVIKLLLKSQFHKIEQIFNSKIEKKLSSIELKYKDEIIKQVKEQTPLFAKCSKLLNENK